MALNKDGYSAPISKALVGKAIRQKNDEAARKWEAQSKDGQTAAGEKDDAVDGGMNPIPAPR